MIGSCWWLG